MCGIFGNFNRNKSIHQSEINNLIKHSKEMKCRGPDFFNYYLDDKKKFFISHLRLSIIDLSSNGNQPMISSDGRYIISFNGEIYNFKELSKKLINLDKSSYFSDTKILVEYISSFGIKKTLEDINGMYAIAIFDIKESYLYLTRDYFGKKPIYYYFNSETIFFSSTLKPLIQNENIKKIIDSKSLDHYFHYGFCPNQSSIFKNINKVPQNSMIKIDLKKWCISEEKIHKDHKDEKDLNFSLDYSHLDKLLFESVEKRFISDVPVGVLLSSGIDSSLVSYYSSQINRNIETYTVGFEEKNFDESEDSKKIANYFGLKNNTIHFESKELQDIIEDIPEAFDEPFADSSQIPTMLIFKKISNYSKVCITGDGGDEIFYGYNRYQWFLIWKTFFKNNLLVNKTSKNLLNYIIDMFESNKLGKKIFEKFNLTSNKTQKFINIFFNDKNIYESFLKLSSETNFLYKNNIFFDKNIFDLQELRNFDIKNYMVDDILTKVDRSSMFNSVEARSPLLDKNIYDYINKVPLKKNINVFSKKKILKKILENKLPKNFISKKKRGFAVPITKYLFRDLKNELYENYNNFKNDDRLACINMTNLIEIINRFFLHNDYKLSYQVWSFYVFFQWFKKYQKYIDN